MCGAVLCCSDTSGVCGQCCPSRACGQLIRPSWIRRSFQAGAQVTERGAALPTRFRNVLYLDVFGWSQPETAEAGASACEKAELSRLQSPDQPRENGRTGRSAAQNNAPNSHWNHSEMFFISILSACLSWLKPPCPTSSPNRFTVYLYGVLTPFKGLHPWAA